MKLVILTTFLLFTLSTVFAQTTIKPDSTFANNGFFTFTNTENRAVAVHVAPSGKIYVLAKPNPNLGGGISLLFRFNSNGSLDNTFGLFQGRVQIGNNATTNFFSFPVVLEDFSILDDEKIVLVGRAQPIGSIQKVIIKLNADGKSLDNAFGDNGITMLSPFSGFKRAYSLGLQSDGKIVVASEVVRTIDTRNVWIFRLNPNGKLDSTFNENQIFVVRQAQSLESRPRVAITQNDEAFISFKSDHKFENHSSQITNPVKTLVRLTSSGVPVFIDYNNDDEFGSMDSVKSSKGAIYYFKTGFSPDSVKQTVPTDFLIDSDGKVVISGIVEVKGGFKYSLLRVIGTGIRDTTFNNEAVFTDFTTSSDGSGSVVLRKVQPTGLSVYLKDNINAKSASVLADANGDYWIVGNSTIEEDDESINGRRIYVKKIRKNGLSDSTFADNSNYLFLFNANVRYDVDRAVFDDNGDLIVVGYTRPNLLSSARQELFVSRFKINQLVTSTKPSFLLKGVSVYPNPLASTLNIKTNNTDNYQLKIMDVSGRLLSSESLSGNTHYQISIQNLNLVTGTLVFVQLSNGNTFFTQKLIVQ